MDVKIKIEIEGLTPVESTVKAEGFPYCVDPKNSLVQLARRETVPYPDLSIESTLEFLVEQLAYRQEIEKSSQRLREIFAVTSGIEKCDKHQTHCRCRSQILSYLDSKNRG